MTAIPVDLASVLAITISGVPIKKVTVEGDTIWTPEPVNLNNQVPYLVPFPVAGEEAPPGPVPPALALTSATSDSLSVAASGEPTEVGFGAVVGFNFYRGGVKRNGATPDADGIYTYTGLADNTAYNLTFTFVNGSGTESAQYGALTTTTIAADHDMSPTNRSAIDGYVVANMKPTAGMPSDGVIIGISTPDKGDYYKAFGGDRTDGVPLFLQQRARYGSISKMWCSELIVKHIIAGHLSLTDTVDMYLADDVCPNADRITIKNLLMSDSGLKDYLQQDAAVQQQLFLHPTTPYDPMPYIRSTPPIFEPGNPPPSMYLAANGNGTYSNSNWVLQARILQALDAEYGTSRDYRTIILEDSVAALNLPSVEWPTTDYMTAPYVRGWTPNLALPTLQATLGPLYFLAAVLGYPTAAELEWTAQSTTYSDAAGSLDGDVFDLVKFAKAHYAGTLTNPAMQQLRREMFNPYLIYTPAGPWEGTGWMGFGLGLINWTRWFGWIGSLAGYNVSMFYNIDTGAVITVMMNNLTSVSLALLYRIAYQLYPDSTAASISQVIRPQKITSALPAGWVGEPGVYPYHAPNNSVPAPVPFYT